MVQIGTSCEALSKVDRRLSYLGSGSQRGACESLFRLVIE
jgi:hypothetical protein